MRILGIDPGKSTGWALLDGTKLVGHGVAKGFVELDLILKTATYDILVIENFRIRPKAPPWLPLTAAETIGMVKYVVEVCLSDRDIRVVLQEPSQKVPIKAARGLSVHERDALGHAIARAVKTGCDPKAFQEYLENRR